MWQYEKKLQYPVKITNTNPKLASLIITQYGGPDGELGASLRYLSQRFAMPYPELKALLTDIEKDIKTAGFDAYFVDHTAGIYPNSAAGVPFNAFAIASKGDVITDLHESLAAEQKARTTYDNILRFCDDPDVKDAIRFLRQREVVHYQRFGEGLRLVQEKLDSKNFYAFNPSFDKPCKK